MIGMRVTLFDIARQAGVSPTAASRDRRQREGPSAPSTLHPTPANLFVAGFTGWRAMNMLPESSRRPLRIAGAEIGDNGDNGSGCATIRLRPGGAVEGRAANTARIRTVDDLGSEVFVHLVIGHDARIIGSWQRSARRSRDRKATTCA